MLSHHNGTTRFAPAALDTALVAATVRARALRRSFKAQAADEDDFRQAILLDLIGRAERFDTSRGTWGAFVSVVTRHAAARLAKHQLRQAQAVTSLSPDHDIADGSQRIDGIDRGLDLRRSLDRLPPRLQGLIGLIADTGSIADAQRASALSPASFYRAVAELRLRFNAEGLAPDLGLGRFEGQPGRRLA